MKINLSLITLSIGLTLSLAAYAGIAEAKLANSNAINGFGFGYQLLTTDRHS